MSENTKRLEQFAEGCVMYAHETLEDGRGTATSQGWLDSADFLRSLIPLVEAGERGQWQPIETAPKDGTEVLAFGWNYGDKSKGYHLPIAFWCSAAGWVERDHDDSLQSLEFITHWQPLPPPPQGDKS